MLGIILQIFKIIGIILLVLLVLALIFILCVLFIPVRYYIKLEAKPLLELPDRDEFKDAFLQNEIVLQGKISWFLHIFSIIFRVKHNGCSSYDAVPVISIEQIKESLYGRVKLFGITIKDFFRHRSKKEKSAKENKDRNRKKTEQNKEIKENIVLSKDEHMTNSLDDIENDDYLSPVKDNVKGETIDSGDSKDIFEEFSEDKLQNGLKEKISLFIISIKKIFEKMVHFKYTITELIDKMKRIRNDYDYYKQLFTGDETKPARDKALRQIKKLLGNIRPTKSKVNIEIGFSDPCLLAEVYAMYGVMLPVLGTSFVVTPFFEKNVFTCDVLIKGRISVFVVLVTAWMFLFDKEIQNFRKLMHK